MRVVLASGNAGKLRELVTLLDPIGFEVIPQSALGIVSAAETGRTFADNALLKARHASRESNLPALADDSGIEVASLSGRPGIFSARFAGAGASDRDNLQKMLLELRAVPLADRRACYRCVIAFVRHERDPEPLLAEGVWEGTIAHEPRGSNGFGYDPLFVPDGFDRTAAQLTPEEKNTHSHRGQALRAMISKLRVLRA